MFAARKAITLTSAAAIIVCAAIVYNRPHYRDHTATQSHQLQLRPATESAGQSAVILSETLTTRSITANGIPDHLVGAFPNPGNPNSITPQNVNFEVIKTPQRAQNVTAARGYAFGYAINGIVFDPFAAEFWQGNPRSGWNYNTLSGAVDLGMDENFAFVKPSGAYHYHGIPAGLLQSLDYSPDAHSPLVGYAADGFPIYALTGIVDSALTKMTSSFQLKPRIRPGGDGPHGVYDGTFIEDYEYIPGSGTLDQCNGAITQSEEYPNGTYAYFLTEAFPVVPRCFAGTPANSFMHRGR